MQQVQRRHKAGFGAAGSGRAQNWFWSRHKAGFGAVGLGSTQSQFWSRHKAGLGAIGLGSAQSRFWSRHKAGSVRQVTKSVLYQDRFCIFYRRYKTGFIPIRVNSHSRLRDGTKPVLEQAQSRFWCGRLQNRFCIKTGFASSIEATKLDLSWSGSIVTAGFWTTQSRFWCSRFSIGAKPALVR